MEENLEEKKVRPIPESGVLRMKKWFIDKDWDDVYKAESAHDNAAMFQKMLLEYLDNIFPEKTRKIRNDDQPWITHRLKIFVRKRKRLGENEQLF